MNDSSIAPQPGQRVLVVFRITHQDRLRLFSLGSLVVTLTLPVYAAVSEEINRQILIEEANCVAFHADPPTLQHSNTPGFPANP